MRDCFAPSLDEHHATAFFQVRIDVLHVLHLTPTSCCDQGKLRDAMENKRTAVMRIVVVANPLSSSFPLLSQLNDAAHNLITSLKK
jgi:hypothetical protein